MAKYQLDSYGLSPIFYADKISMIKFIFPVKNEVKNLGFWNTKMFFCIAMVTPEPVKFLKTQKSSYCWHELVSRHGRRL